MPDSEHTSIAGASLGGLMAFYAVIKHPDIFSVAMALSPAFWINPEIRELLAQMEIPDHIRVYMAIGADEVESMQKGYKDLLTILQEKAVSENQFKSERVEGGEHNEDFWSRQFEQGYNWLFPK